MSRLLLLSNSTLPGTPFLSWPATFVREFLGDERGNLLFIPFAAVTFSYDEYAKSVREAVARWGYEIESVHNSGNCRQAVNDAAAVVIGGGNTFALLNQLYRHGLVGLIKEKVRWGTPFIGWSAGANVACPTLMTTNDMPIVMPPSFDALNLVPFQINPHYTGFKQPGHGGETRRQRIDEFLTLNPTRRVIGLPEGMLLSVEENNLALKGSGTAVLFVHDKPPENFSAGDDVGVLLRETN